MNSTNIFKKIRKPSVVLLLMTSVVATIFIGKSNSPDIASVPIAELETKFLMPSVVGNSLSSTWFCPGVPARDVKVKSEIVIANPTRTPITGTITFLSSEEPATSSTLIVAPFSRGVFDATGGHKSQFISAIIELDSGQASVEQRIIHLAGDSVALCANETSDRWFFADGFTGAESEFDILLTNPFPDSTVVDLTFVTTDGKRQPALLKGIVLRGQSVTGISMGEQGARNESVLAVSVRATSGRFIAGKLQHFLGRGRLGFTSALGASTTSRQWWFASGEKGAGVDEELVVFNPTEIDQSVSIAFLTGSAEALLREPLILTVPAGRVTTLSTSSLPAIANGRYGILVSSVTGDFISSNDDTATEFVVVEQIVSRTSDNKTGTSVILGAPSGSPSRVWTSPSGLTVGEVGSIVVANTTSLDTTIRVSTIGPAGAAPIVGLEQVVLKAASVISIAIPPSIAQLQILIESETEVVVQREFSRGHQLYGLSGVLALPYRSQQVATSK
jgi:hypothetical protein